MTATTKSLFRLSLGVFTTLLAFSPLASAFEGKIDMTISTPKKKENMAMSYYMKGMLLRMEMTPSEKSKKDEPQTMVSLMNLETSEVTILMPEQQKYMVIKTKRDMVEHAATKTAQDFAPTGRSEKIAGIQAEEYVGSPEGKRTEIWVTKELGQFMMANKGGPMGGGAPKSSGWESFAKQGDFFPLRTIIRAKDGKTEEFHLETTAVEKKTLEASLFAPPAGYEKFEMPDFGNAMRGLVPGNH